MCASEFLPVFADSKLDYKITKNQSTYYQYNGEDALRHSRFDDFFNEVMYILGTCIRLSGSSSEEKME